MKKHPKKTNTELTWTELTWKVVENLVQEKGGGLISEYLHFKMIDYEEPTRKGTPKGEKIGFTAKKYCASILVGTKNDKLKDIAQQSDVSYGLLRKWKTESDFQAEADKHCSEFVAEIINRVRTRLKKQEKDFEDFYDGYGVDPLRKDLESPLDASERVLIDAHLFSEKVLNRLVEAAQTIFKESNDYALFKSIVDVIVYAKRKDFSLHHPLVTKRFVAEVKEMVSAKRTLSEKEQRIAITNLTLAENELDLIYNFFKNT